MIEMGDTVNELGTQLQKQYPDFFRLTSEKRWEININGQWVQLPHHYWPGLAMTVGGSIGLAKAESKKGAVLSFLSLFTGVALALDDKDDLIKDAKKLWNYLLDNS